jgi:hypothetical protein
MSFKRRFRDVRRRSARRHENDVDAAGARHYILCAVSTPRAIRPGNNGWARNLVERFFNRIKQCRRVATRYDKLAANYLAFIKLAAIRIWLRAYESTP